MDTDLCQIRHPRGYSCELAAGHAGPHQRTASDGSFIANWDQVFYRINFPQPVPPLARSPDGAILAAARRDGPAKMRVAPGGAGIIVRPSIAQLRRRLKSPDRRVRMEAWQFLRYRRQRGMR